MADKITQLEGLVSRVLAQQAALKKQNETLAKRVRDLEATASELKQTQTELKEVREWKKNAQNVLRRLSVKIGKEIEKQKQTQDRIA